MRKWVLNLVLKFHEDPTINESGIIVLLRYVWMYAEKESFMRGTFLPPQTLFRTSQRLGDVWKLVPNLVYKFHDDSTVNEFGIVVLLGQIGVYARKREDFGRERRQIWEEERAQRRIINIKINLIYFYLLGYF